jgi:hypothetical protein
MAGKWFKSWARSRVETLNYFNFGDYLFLIYLLTLDPEDERSVGVVAEGTSQRRASLRVPLRPEQLTVGSAVLLPRLQGPARPFVQPNQHIQFKRKEKETKWLVHLLILNSPICPKGENKSKGREGTISPAHFHAPIDTDRNWIGRAIKEIQMGKFVFNRDGR